MCPKYTDIYLQIQSWDDPLWHDWLAHKKVCDECDRKQRPKDLLRLREWNMRHTRQMELSTE